MSCGIIDREHQNKPPLAQRLYAAFAAWQDRRLGGLSAEQRKASRFAAQGAEAVQSSDYRALGRIFRRHVTLTAADTLLDVGCGEGRVLTWLAGRRCKARLVGVELDPEVAATARRRAAACPGGDRIQIRCANILDETAADLWQTVTVYYLFNPFNGKIFSKFVAKLEKTVPHPVRLVYLFDYYAGYLDGRPGWQKLAAERFARPGADDAEYSVWQYTPPARSTSPCS